MTDLIEALTILARYGNPSSPTHCEHDIMYLMIEPRLVSPEDTARLDELDVIPREECFISYRFGSA